jgi:hypothetical protein
MLKKRQFGLRKRAKGCCVRIKFLSTLRGTLTPDPSPAFAGRGWAVRVEKV